MNRLIFSLIAILSSNFVFGQSENRDTLIDNTQSSKYLFKAYIERCPEGTSNCNEQCVINIYSKASKELFQVLTFEIEKDYDAGFYREIDYFDLNFDGIKDFSIPIGQPGVYCDSRRKFFLFDANTKKFIYSTVLTSLVEEYCTYDFDTKKKEVIGLIHEGCCYHGDVSFIWRGNKLIKIFERIKDDQDDSEFSKFTVKRLIKGKWKVSEYKKKRK